MVNGIQLRGWNQPVTQSFDSYLLILSDIALLAEIRLLPEGCRFRVLPEEPSDLSACGIPILQLDRPKQTEHQRRRRHCLRRVHALARKAESSALPDIQPIRLQGIS